MNTEIASRVKQLVDGVRPRPRIYVMTRHGDRRRVKGITWESVVILKGGERFHLPWGSVVGVEVQIGSVGNVGEAP